MAPRTLSLPVIDLGAYQRDHEERSALFAQLRDAVHRVGFFYLVGHGIDQRRMDRVLDLARAFFDLPASTLHEIDAIRSRHFRGYTSVGKELTKGWADWRDQLDVALELPERPPSADLPAYWGLQGPNQWPHSLPAFRTEICAWMDDVSRVARDLLRALSESLYLPAHYFDDAFTPDPHVHLKVVRYHGRTDGVDDQGVGAHKDYGFLTLVLQDDAGGLQVLDGSGAYVDVAPVPGAFIVNLGEMLEVATGGFLRATLHRVVSPPPGRVRFSVPFFYNPRLDYVVEPVNLPFTASVPGVAVDPTNPLFAEYGYNALKGKVRAHPELAAAHGYAT
jgi:isopenicillin N synthase-like dioxygenase